MGADAEEDRVGAEVLLGAVVVVVQVLGLGVARVFTLAEWVREGGWCGRLGAGWELGSCGGPCCLILVGTGDILGEILGEFLIS